ncbi:expressed unknown protein [Seminavis robusta]|uniref:Transmembrane protein n=1 Tax=Seminavis robusta TaxID=568900 RepID=A0A9N8DIP1_9STRA|nr:expressed unknown protein [Seminavis robusta]|eukprot:Sro109_g054630.1 n/a (317) ;mRNA; r:84541-85491
MTEPAIDADNHTTLVYDIYAPQYPWWCFNFLILIWCLGCLTEFILLRTNAFGISSKFQALTLEKRRNVVIYILQIFVTTLSLALQLAGGVDLIFRLDDTTSELRFTMMLVSSQIIFVLYMWELIYRISIGTPLLVHHVMTCVMAQLLALSIFDAYAVVYLRLAVILSCYATTEQSSFVALLCYRLDLFSKKVQYNLFTLAAIQSFIFKTAIAIFSLLYFCVTFYIQGEADDQPTNWKWFWKICFIPLVVVLFGAQVYSSQILWTLRLKCSSEVEESNQENPQSMDASSESKSTQLLDTVMDDSLRRVRDVSCEIDV